MWLRKRDLRFGVGVGLHWMLGGVEEGGGFRGMNIKISTYNILA